MWAALSFTVNATDAPTLQPTGPPGNVTVGAGGDPHFITWDGDHYTYGGSCDLVMATSTMHGWGLGLDIHARTESHPSGFSFISKVALRIGADVLEVMNNGTYLLNGLLNPDLPAKLSVFDLYKKKFEKCLWNKIHSAKPCREYELFTIDLGKGDYIQISDEIFMHVDVQGSQRHFEKSTGLLGTYGKPGMIARDGVTSIDDPNDFGNEWQVSVADPKLFHSPSVLQHPEGCIPPAPLKPHRLRKLHEHVALEACDHVEGLKKEFCMFDVTVMGDFNVAHTPFYHT